MTFVIHIHAAAKSHNTVLTLAQKGEDILLINSGALTSTLDVSKMEKAKQFVDKIKEVLQNIKEWINNVLSKLTSSAPEAQDLRALAKDLDAISKKWDEMLRQSAKSNAAMKKVGVNDKVDISRDRPVCAAISFLGGCNCLGDVFEVHGIHLSVIIFINAARRSFMFGS